MDKGYNIASLCAGGLDGETDAKDRLRIAPCFGGCALRFEGVGLQSDAAFFSTWATLAKRMGALFDKKKRLGKANHGGMGYCKLR